ncbi:MAG TPA: LysR family transcriptional regulator [Acidimicrobiales bacterium]
MDLRQLAALVAVAEHRSFSAAADALHTVQSNVSTHVARLEKELGVQLIDRQSGQLTHEGQAVVDRARRIQAELDALVSDVAALRDEVVGTVRLGVIGTTARWLVPPLVDRLAEEYPKVRLIVYEATSVNLEPRLANSQLDLAVVNLPLPGDDLVGRPLFDEDLVLVLSHDHPLAKHNTVKMADLDGVALLLPAPGTSLRDDIDRAAADSGVVLLPKAELDGVRLIASLTFDGHGPAILPATGVPDRLAGSFRRVNVEGLPRRQVAVAMRRRGLPTQPTKAVLAVLDELITSDVGRRFGIHPPAEQ